MGEPLTAAVLQRLGYVGSVLCCQIDSVGIEKRCGGEVYHVQNKVAGGEDLHGLARDDATCDPPNPSFCGELGLCHVT